MLDFHLLGPLRLYGADRFYPVDGATQKTLLLALLLRADHTVRAEALRYELWGASRPESQENALHAHISRLRALLARAEPERHTSRLLAEHGGYRLVAGDHEIDGCRFQSLVAKLRQQAVTMAPQHLAVALRQALVSWSGPVFGGLRGGPICQAGRHCLENVQLETKAMIFDAELRSGNHRKVIAELRPLVTTDTPFLERFAEQLMIALYQSGRQVDALQVYRQVVCRLGNEGRPSAVRLKRCEQAILRQDRSLDSASGSLAA